MCGCFGFISNDGRDPDPGILQEIALETEGRGRHAHGLAWIDRRGRLRHYKAPGRISDDLECLDFADDARMMIGHCRYATRGRPFLNGNNHPHACDGGWVVHNGTVYNHRGLVDRYDLPRVSDCDSEVLGLLTEELDGTLLERAAGALELSEGPQVMLGLWARPARMVVARRGKPLHIAQDGGGNVYFASLPSRLNDPDRILDDTVRLFRFQGGELYQSIERIAPCRKRPREKSPGLGRPLRRYVATDSSRARPSLASR